MGNQQPITNAAEFGRIVRQTRKQLGYTQVALADLSGTGERFIVELERGKQTIELGKALHIARVLGLRIYAQPHDP